MPTGEYNHPLFGLVKFKTKDPTWVYGGEIVFTQFVLEIEIVVITTGDSWAERQRDVGE